MKKLLYLFILLFIPSVAFSEYRGETFVIDLSRGGFSHDHNLDRLPPTAMAEGTRNINLHKGGRSKRGGTDHVNGTVIDTTPKIWGVYQYIQEDGTESLITAGSDGEILADFNQGTPIATGLTINRAVHFATFNNLLYICTGNDVPYVWTGTGSAVVMTNPAVEWNGGGNVNYPKKMVVHGRGASERLWAISGATDAYTVFASAISSGDNTTQANFVTGVVTLYVDTGDGGVINAVEYGDRLLCFGKRRVYIIDDTDTDTANWGYEKSQWEGGTATDRTVIAVTNDIVSMTEDGTVYSVTTAQAYGDYKKTTITREPFVDEWIRENIKLSSIDDFHMVYDPVIRAIYIFVNRQGSTFIDTALVYFIDRGPIEGWTIKDNQNADSGYKAACSALVRKAQGDNKIYTGGVADGFVWELETSTLNDNTAAYDSGFKTPRLNLGDPRATKRFDTGWIVTLATGASTIAIDIWVDGELVGEETVAIIGSGSVYSGGVYGTGVYGGVGGVEEASFPIHRDGKRIEFQVYNNTEDEDLFGTLMMLDFMNLGRKVE